MIVFIEKEEAKPARYDLLMAARSFRCSEHRGENGWRSVRWIEAVVLA